MEPLIYKLNCDDNGAPCVTDDLLTLAICKPGYRSVARCGNYLLGFMGRSSTNDHTEPLVYMAEITVDPMSIKEYYSRKEYRKRPDCIYKYVKGKFALRKNALYHNIRKNAISSINKDLGKKRDAKVILSRNFRYLGDKSEIIDPKKYPELTCLVKGLTQTNYPLKNIISKEIIKECTVLKSYLWKKYPEMKIGIAIDRPDPKKDCGTGSRIICLTA